MGVHRRAVTRMLRFTGLAQLPDEAPLVELVKALADEMDGGGGARTRADYLSALKDVRRVLDRAAAPARKSTAKPEVDPPVVEPPSAEQEAASTNDLARFKAARGIA